MKFTPHGKLAAIIEENILIIKGAGPWNKEALERASTEFSDLLRQLYGKKWAVMLLIHGDPIHTPDATELLIEAIKEDKKHGRITTAIVLNDCDDIGFAKIHIADIYDKSGEDIRFFNDEYSARKWLSKQLP